MLTYLPYQMLRQSHWIIVLLLYFSYQANAQRAIIIGSKGSEEPPYTIKGKVYSLETGEKILGANLVIEGQNLGTSTDVEGVYTFSLYPGAYTLLVSYVGYASKTKTISILGSGTLNFGLKRSVTELDEFVVQSEGEDENISSKIAGKSVLDLESIKTLPPLAGEVDVLKSLTLLPGVATQGEASSGFSVRGGGTDQNLILLGGATLYNPSHLFGFFSGFNANVVRSVSLYKGVVPAQYGGRASSVIDVSYKKGNFRNWDGTVTLGLVSSKVTAGGPLIKDKLSLMAAGRIAYPNWLLQRSNDPNISNSTANFYDGNLIFNYIIDEKNDLEYSIYNSSDGFNFSNGLSNEWSNLAQVLKWNSQINQKLSLSLSLIQSKYNSDLIDNSQTNRFRVASQIVHNQANLGLNWVQSKKSTIKTGVQTTFLKNDIGNLRPEPGSNTTPVTIDSEQGTEIGIYAQHELDITGKFGITYGLRYSNFSDRGPATINVYEPGRSRSLISIVDSLEFSGGSIQTYQGWEPRIQFRYKVSPTLSLKGGISQANQYIHLITNTSSALPTDVWKLSDPFLKPQIVRQYSIGLFKNLKRNKYEISLEGYYKDLSNLVDFKEGADLFVNPALETELVATKGTSYGVEFFIKKSTGRFNGWFSYTYARSWRTANSVLADERINNGERFAANLDSPHALNIVGDYRLGANTKFSFVFTYNSGRPFTLPIGKFEFEGVDLALFEDRNNERAPNNHRLDLSLQFKIPSKHQALDGDWTLALYNAYGRNNPFSVFFQDLNGLPPQAYKLAIVGNPFPTLSYEFTF